MFVHGKIARGETFWMQRSQMRQERGVWSFQLAECTAHSHVPVCMVCIYSFTGMQLPPLFRVQFNLISSKCGCRNEDRYKAATDAVTAQRREKSPLAGVNRWQNTLKFPSLPENLAFGMWLSTVAGVVPAIMTRCCSFCFRHTLGAGGRQMLDTPVLSAAPVLFRNSILPIPAVDSATHPANKPEQ